MRLFSVILVAAGSWLFIADYSSQNSLIKEALGQKKKGSGIRLSQDHPVTLSALEFAKKVYPGATVKATPVYVPMLREYGVTVVGDNIILKFMFDKDGNLTQCVPMHSRPAYVGLSDQEITTWLTSALGSKITDLRQESSFTLNKLQNGGKSANDSVTYHFIVAKMPHRLVLHRGTLGGLVRTTFEEIRLAKTRSREFDLRSKGVYGPFESNQPNFRLRSSDSN